MRPPINVIKKICLLGNPSVGKTSLIQRFVFDTFSEDYLPTIGTKVVKKSMDVEAARNRLQPINLTFLIFDLLGQVEFANVHKTYYMGSEGALIVGDLTRSDSLLSIEEWHGRFMDVVGEVHVLYLGNKNDIAPNQNENKELLGEMASRNDVPYLYTSAKTGRNVERAFKLLAEGVLEESPI